MYICPAFKSNQYGSSNSFLEKMDYLVENFIQPKSKIVFSLGEIDIRAHVFKKTLRQNVDYKQIVDGILENYIIFLNAMKNKQFEVFAWGRLQRKMMDCQLIKIIQDLGLSSKEISERYNMVPV